MRKSLAIYYAWTGKTKNIAFNSLLPSLNYQVTCRITVYLRGAGGFSKSSKPFSYSNYPLNQISSVKIPESKPFSVFEDHTQPSQACIIYFFNFEPAYNNILLTCYVTPSQHLHILLIQPHLSHQLWVVHCLILYYLWNIFSMKSSQLVMSQVIAFFGFHMHL